MSRLLFEARAAVLACEAKQALIEKEIELEKLKQQRKPLTDEELSKLVSCTKWRSDESMHTYAVRACRAVEAKLREKNEPREKNE